ncbi:MAG: sigma-70 family RNA polymerase sigma factor [Anaerolineales bacterium]|jgi:RNA polymerase primary sigma factor
MVSILNQNLLTKLEQEKTGEAALARLVALGREQGYITFDNILDLLPDAEQDMELLDEVFAALLNAGISYSEEAPEQEQVEIVSEEEEEENPGDEASHFPLEEDYLANIDVGDTIGLYLKEAARVPLLTADEELELAQRIERGRMAREELARGNVSQHRRTELHQLVTDGWIAREHLITANSRLVISVAKKYIGRGVPFLDLIQEGNIGLMRAAKKFDYHRGYKFSTYATWWIRQAVTRAVADQGRTIRVPVHMGDQISKMLRAQHQLKQKLSRDPTPEEIAEVLEVSAKKVENMIQVARRPLSLQMPIGDEEEDMLGDFIEDQEAPPPDELATDNLLREHVRDILGRLPPREARILQLRYGLLDGQTLTLNEVGRKMGVTRERVRQIEAQALRRLRSLGLQRELRAYIE